MFVYNLCKMLKKTKLELITTMGSDELLDWVAYMSLQDEDYRKKIQRQVDIENINSQTEEESNKAILDLFKGLSNGYNR